MVILMKNSEMLESVMNAEFIGGPKDGAQIVVSAEVIVFPAIMPPKIVFFKDDESIKKSVFTEHKYKLRKRLGVATRLPNGFFPFDYIGESK